MADGRFRLDLNGDVGAVVEAMNEAVDPAIEQGKEDVQAAT